jgi:putative membrane protein insertion efficiency factor
VRASVRAERAALKKTRMIPLARYGSPPHVAAANERKTMVARLLIALVRAYQIVLSPWLGRVCRFEPSCSRYAVACLEGHGALKGSLLSVKRLCKCHPFHPGGVDPPPQARAKA